MSNIYTLAEEYRALLNMLDTEGDESMMEAIKDTLAGLGGDLSNHVESCVKAIKCIEGDVAALEAEIDRLDLRRRAFNARIERIREAVKCCMTAADTQKIQTALFTVSIAKGRESVQISDESLIPDDYVNVKTVIQPDKKLIAEAIKSGTEIPGAQIVVGEPSLRIK